MNALILRRFRSGAMISGLLLSAVAIGAAVVNYSGVGQYLAAGVILGGLALVVLTRPAPAFAGWLLVAPFLQESIRSTHVGYVLSRTCYALPPLFFALVSVANVRRDVLTSIGGFDESLFGVEDYDLWLRLAAAGYTALRVPGRHAIYRRRVGSLSSDRSRMITGLATVYSNMAKARGSDPRVREIARKRAISVSVSASSQTSFSWRLRVKAHIPRRMRNLVVRVRDYYVLTPRSVRRTLSYCEQR